jgi:branched-chain amino acid aminotransferase
MNIPVVEEMITRDQLYIADEVFITGTAAEMVPVRMVDFRQVGKGKPGPITETLSLAFSDTVHGLGVRSAEWLDLIPIDQPVSGESVLINFM